MPTVILQMSGPGRLVRSGRPHARSQDRSVFCDVVPVRDGTNSDSIMINNHWLRCLQNRFRTQRRSARQTRLQSSSQSAVGTAADVEVLEDRSLLAAFGFDFDVIGSELHQTLRAFGSPDPSDAPYTQLRYGQGTINSLTDFPNLAAASIQPSDITFQFGSDNAADNLVALSLDDTSFDDGTSDGVVNQFYVPGAGTDNSLTVFNDGVAAATGNLISIEVRTDTSEVSTGIGVFELTGAVGNDTTIFDELNTLTAGTGTVNFTLGVFGYAGNPFGVGDAALFSSDGNAVFDAQSVGLTGAGPFVVAVEGGDYVTRDEGSGNAEISRVPVTSVTDLYVNGSAGNDTLNVDFSNGAFPIFYNGGAGDDALAIQGGTFGTVTYGADGPTSGGIEFGSGGSTITYTGLEPIFDNTSATNRVFTFSDAVDNITLSDDGTPGDGMSRIAAPGTAETVDFMNPTDSIQINAGGGGDTVNLVGLDAVGMPSQGRDVRGDGGNDVLNASTFANGGWGFEGGAGDDTIIGTGVTDAVRWRDGDGNDNIDLGPSPDNLFVFGNNGLDDNFVINPNGAGFLVQRTNLTPVTLTVANVTDLEINGSGGSDSATVNALPGLSGELSITLNGGEGHDVADLSALPDPNIDVTVEGQNGDDTIVVAAGGESGNGSLDDFFLFMNGNSFAQMDVGNLDVGVVTTVFESSDRSGANSIVVNGSTDEDILVVDFQNGNPIPDGGVVFNGGTGSNPDEIELENTGSFTAITYNFTNPSDGSIDLDGDTITFTGLELPTDFGDAPDTGAGTGSGNYQTLQADDGPSHTIVTGLRLGAEVDGEDGTLQNVAANADDVDGVLPDGEPDDEDGVLSPFDLLGTIGAAPSVTLLASNRSSNAATLSGWIDYNQDGLFDNATERSQITVPAGTTDDRFTLVFPVIPEGSTGVTYARFRLSTDVAAENPTGVAGDGEIEDYMFSITKVSDSSVDSYLKIASDANGGPTLNGGDVFGGAVASLGDLDGDGVTDLAVGAYGDDTGGVYSNRGAVHVLFMNGDGSVKGSVKIASDTNGGPTLADGDQFGRSVVALGDLDGDGVVDLAVGASRDNTGGGSYSYRGAVHVLMLNSDGSVKSSTKIASDTSGGATLSDNDFFGKSVAALGDLDGDGVPDLAVGAFGDDTGGEFRGALHVLLLNPDGSAKSSAIIASDTNGGPTLNDSAGFGYSAAVVGDLDGDGVPDLAVGTAGEDAVHILFMNDDGSAKTTNKIASGVNGGPVVSGGDYFGSSLASVGDLDGDGIGDLAVGAYGSAGTYQGGVHLLLLNADGSAKSSELIASDTNGGPTLVNDDEFGSSVTSLGDLDGDGVTDLAVGARGADAAYVLFLSRRPGFTLSKTTASVSEDGITTTDSFTVVLDVQPVSDVVLDLSLSANPDAALDETSLTFTSANWNQPQTVSITGLNDDADDGDEQTTITVSVNDAASDDAYDSLADQTVTVTTTDDDDTPLPGNVDGDGDFDANDSFLVQLVLLSATDAQIDQSKGSSTLTAAEIRAQISSLGLAGDVDGDGDTDANDAFLIHLVKLSGTDNQIDQSKGTSPLSAVEIRTNVNNLGGGTTTSAAAAQVLKSVLAEEPADVDSSSAESSEQFLIPSVLPDLFFSGDENERNVQQVAPLSAAVPDSVWEGFRDWIDAI